jgi:Fe-S cluster biogenesis protein NfuA
MPKIAEIEYSPNPNAIKFILKEPIASGFPRNFPNAEIAQADSLAKALFDVGHVKSVFMIDKWMTIIKEEGIAWNELLPVLAPLIREAPPIANAASPAPHGMTIASDAADDPFLQKVFETLKERILPYMAADGGGLEVIGRREKQVMIRYMGACQNCPAGVSGTLMAIEGILKSEVDSDISVITV